MALDFRAGHATFSQRFGHGGRRALAIHCTLGRSGAWAAMAAHLADDLTITAFDKPGHGKSADWDGTRDFIALTARIAEGFIDGPVDLIGHSGGAVAALRLALAMPEAVRSLTLIEPVLFAAARGFPEWDMFAIGMAPYLQALEDDDRETAARVFTTVWGSGTPWAEQDARTRAYVAARIHLIRASFPALADDNGGLLDEGGLETLDLPVMLIAGARSPAVIHRINEEIAARLPDVGVATVDGAGHMLPVTHPSQVAGLVRVNLERS